MDQINKMLVIAEKQREKFKDAPEGRIRARNNRKSFQYYLRQPGERDYRYLKVKERSHLGEMIQRDYYCEMYRKLKNAKSALEAFLKKYDYSEIMGVYDNLAEGRKPFIKPIIMPDAEYIEKWRSGFDMTPNGFVEDRVFVTENGEMARSKSEKIIADMLKKYGVPYVYEPRYTLRDRVAYPDFAALNLRRRKTVIWEHLGKIDDSGYVSDNLLKLQDYERSGFMCGRDLIITLECRKKPLDIKMVEDKIREYLL